MELLPEGDQATHFEVQILDPNKNKARTIRGDILPTKNKNLAYAAI